MRPSEKFATLNDNAWIACREDGRESRDEK